MKALAISIALVLTIFSRSVCRLRSCLTFVLASAPDDETLIFDALRRFVVFPPCGSTVLWILTKEAFAKHPA